MRDVLNDIERWRARGERVAVATVVSMAGSAPRRPGAKLVVSESGELAGSVSGGCIYAVERAGHISLGVRRPAAGLAIREERWQLPPLHS